MAQNSFDEYDNTALADLISRANTELARRQDRDAFAMRVLDAVNSAVKVSPGVLDTPFKSGNVEAGKSWVKITLNAGGNESSPSTATGLSSAE